MARADIDIVGGGIFGLSIAFVCARRGARVRLIEKRHVGAGASGGVLGALTPHAPDRWNAKKQFQLDCLRDADSWWREVERVGGKSAGFERCGRLQPIDDEQALALAEHRADEARRHWGRSFAWRIRPSRDFANCAPRSQSGWLIHDSLSARLDPRRAINCLMAALRALNCVIEEGALGARAAPRQILATGHEGLTELSHELGLPIGGGEKGQAMIVDRRMIGCPQIFGDALHIVPQPGGVAIGSTSERQYREPVQVDEALDQLRERAERLMPQLAGARVLERWAGVRPRASSRAPLLGRHPTRSDVYIANGGFKTGYGLAPGIANAMADLVLDEAWSVPDAFCIDNLVTRMQEQPDPQSRTR